LESADSFELVGQVLFPRLSGLEKLEEFVGAATSMRTDPGGQDDDDSDWEIGDSAIWFIA
jgi:hypothetical protein